MSTTTPPDLHGLPAGTRFAIAPKFHITLHVAGPERWYWSQPAQNWTRTATAATLFDSRAEADTEAFYARRSTSHGESVAVHEGNPAQPQAIEPKPAPKTGPLEVGEVLKLDRDVYGRFSVGPRQPTALLLVTRLTATQAIAEHFGPGPVYSREPVRLRHDGRLIGGGGGMYAWAYRATQEDIDKVIADAHEAARYRAARERLGDLIGKELHQLKLTTGQLEHLAKAWEQVKAMAPATTSSKA